MPPLGAPFAGGVDRRQLLKLIAAGAAASVAACRRPDDTIHPMTVQPEGTQAGVVSRYATALPLAGYLRGVTGLVVDGRPIKLEGLAAHSASLGATDVFVETAILDLYDPQRLKAPTSPDGPASWDGLAGALRDRVLPRRGEGLALLTGRVTSPTLLARVAALRAKLPGLRHVRWEPFSDDAALAASRGAFGRPLTALPRLADADVVLLLDADPLGPGPAQIAHAAAWAARRRQSKPTRMYAAEGSPSASGVMADRRVAASPRDLAALCHALAAGLGAEAASAESALSPELTRFAADAARDLMAAKGRALVIAGDRQPAAIHAFAAWANGVLAAPIDWIAPVDADAAPHGEGIASLAADMHARRIDTLVTLEANPCYAAPVGLGFAQAMARVPLTIAATTMPNETSGAARWAMPLTHPLEGWHDGRAHDGTASIAQPLVRRFFDTRTGGELVDLIGDPASASDSLAQVRAQWASLDAGAWQATVAGGVVPDTRAAPEQVGAAPLVLPGIPAAGLTLDLRPSPTLYDGRSSANAWAQECPDPLTKEVWGASLRLNPADMAAMGVADGDLVRLASGGAVVLPARATAGQALGVATVLTGYGRHGTGAIADGIGANGFVLTGADVRLAKAEGHAPVLTTQHQFALDGELAKLFPVLAPGQAMSAPERLPTLLPNPAERHAPPTQWAMAIDTDVCIGCNACVVACQAENNVPAIGPEEIAAGRDMHWLRIDRYEHDHGEGFQPVPCMQCEAAPCEPVCPVEASVHDAQGLNLQVYNRCIGTRTCQANCPYKVRRFNFRDYTSTPEDGPSLWGDEPAASVSAQRNPDVTVRARGVMEKCTYCVQRIEAHNRDADAGGHPAPVVTACQAACPTRAIAFGPKDAAPIRDARQDPRHYALLEELGTRPRTTYLARRRNPGAA